MKSQNVFLEEIENKEGFSQEILTFEEFLIKIGQKNRKKSFYMYFTEGFVGASYRSKSFFRFFLKNHRELDRRLRSEIKRALEIGPNNILKKEKLLINLYLAYVYLRKYGARDEDLFG